MIRFLPLFALLFTSPFLTAQSVSGTLEDAATGEPVGFASVAVYAAGDSLVKGATTDFDGKFEIDDLTEGEYRIEASFLGYETETRPVILTDKLLQLETIMMEQGGAANLEEVTVTAERAVMELGLDRRSFNVEKSIAASGGSAQDLLRQLPGITVDIEGNVSLRGSGNVRFLINGRPSGLVGTDPATFLQGLPANSVEKVEIITNPGAAFDPDGTAGLINIVLKKKRDDGLNATFTANVGTNNKYDGSVDANYRTGKWNHFFGLSAQDNERFFRGERDQFLAENFRRVDFRFDRFRRSLLLRGGTEFRPTERATVGLQANVQWEDGDTDGLRTINTFDQFAEPRELREENRRQELGPETEREYEFRLTYDQDLKTEGRKFSGVLQYGQGEEQETEEYLGLVTRFPGGDSFVDNQRGLNDEEQADFLGEINYTHPLGDYKFETGWRTTRTDLLNDVAFQQDVTGNRDYETIFELSNLFDYDETIHALYGTLGGKLGEDVTFSAGLRAEQAYQISTLLEPDFEAFRQEYFRLYPSVFLGYAFSEGTTVQASYSRRVNRPRQWALNPFIDRGDPFNLRGGNPFLLPEFINSFEANVQHQIEDLGSLTGGVYFRQQNDLITRVTRLVEPGVQLATFDNLERGREYGLEAIGNLRPVKGLELVLSANAFRNELLGDIDNEEVDQGGFFFSGNAQANFELPFDLKGQLIYFYRGPGIRPQGEVEAIQSLDFGLRKTLWDKRAAITLRVSDVLNTRRYRYNQNVGGIFTETEFQRESRILFVGFQYSLRELREERGRGGRGGGGGDDF